MALATRSRGDEVGSGGGSRSRLGGAGGAGAGAGTGAHVGEASTQASPYPVEEKFFGVCPLKFTEDILNAVDDYINDAVDEIEAEMKKELPPASAIAARGRRGKGKGRKKAATSGTDPVAQLQDSCDKLVMLMRAVFDKNFDMFEIYSLRNVLKVPAEALEDEEPTVPGMPDTDYTIDDERELDVRLETLRDSVTRATIAKWRLQRAATEFESHLQEFETRTTQLKSVTAALEAHGVWPPGPAMDALADRTRTMDELEVEVKEQLGTLQHSTAAARAAHHSAAPLGRDDDEDMGAFEAAFVEDKEAVSTHNAESVTHHMGDVV